MNGSDCGMFSCKYAEYVTRDAPITFTQVGRIHVILRLLFISESMGIGAIQVLRNAGGGGGINFSGKKRYEGVQFNIISVTSRWVGVQFPEKKRYATLEWPRRLAGGRLIS